MVTLYLAVAGMVVGLALDALIVRLAVPFDDVGDDAKETGLGAQAAGPGAPDPLIGAGPSIHAETGSLVVGPSPARTWARRLLVVGVTGSLFALAGTRYDDPSHLAIVTAYISVLVICTGTDILSFRVPNIVTYPAILGALVVGAAMPGADIVEVLAGGLLAGGVLFVPALLTGGVGMGMGDVKLATFAGLALGFLGVVPAMLFMALGGGGVALLLLATGLRKRGEPIPYAPFVAFGAATALLWQGAAFARLV